VYLRYFIARVSGGESSDILIRQLETARAGGLEVSTAWNGGERQQAAEST
jgi:hypothetical protein